MARITACFFPDGDGLRKPMVEHDTVLLADSPWTLYAWVQPQEALTAPTLLAGLGNTDEEYPRYLGYDGSKLTLWIGADNILSARTNTPLEPGKWHLVGATFDGTSFRLYSDGTEVGSGKLTLGRVSPLLQIAPGALPWPNGQHFGGKIAALTLVRRALSADEIKQLLQQPPDFSVVEFEDGSKPWPVQTRGQAGYRAPQDPSTWPKSKAPFSKPVAIPLPKVEPRPAGQWRRHLDDCSGWELTPAPKVSAMELRSRSLVSARTAGGPRQCPAPFSPR